MAREELKWQNIDADDLPAEVKKSFDAMVEAEAAFKADLEKLLKNECTVTVFTELQLGAMSSYSIAPSRTARCDPGARNRAARGQRGPKS